MRTLLVAVLPVPEDDLAHPGQRVTEGEERGAQEGLHLHTVRVSLLGQEGVGRLAGDTEDHVRGCILPGGWSCRRGSFCPYVCQEMRTRACGVTLLSHASSPPKDSKRRDGDGSAHPRSTVSRVMPISPPFAQRHAGHTQRRLLSSASTS